ncbi:MAG: hypothetical protein OXM61_05735 [Candidatus Poribacteria bacterium]|nr:hypothetical protein [Candidatus Poribacteria bacterium]
MMIGFFKKALNAKKGPFRLTLVLSIIIGGFLGNKAGQLQDRSYDGWFDFLTWFLGGQYGSTYYAHVFQLEKFMAVFFGTSAIIWSIYFIIYWIAVGFTNKE